MQENKIKIVRPEVPLSVSFTNHNHGVAFVWYYTSIIQKRHFIEMIVSLPEIKFQKIKLQLTKFST